MALVDRYEADHDGWYLRHFYGFYRDRGGTRSYIWVKNKLQEHGKVERGRGRGRHRKRREPAPVPGMLSHQDASTHEWVPGEWWDLVVTMDDATNEHHSMFLCDEEGTRSSFLGIRETVEGSAFVAMADPGRLDNIEVRGARADGWSRQLRELRGAGAAAAR